jgi:hypothetical protein
MGRSKEYKKMKEELTDIRNKKILLDLWSQADIFNVFYNNAKDALA